MVVGDFNGDGKTDLAVADLGGVSNVSVLMGNGDGTFRAKLDYGAGSGPNAVAVGDFNGDGRADLATANNSSDDVSIPTGHGSRDSFRQPRSRSQSFHLRPNSRTHSG